MPALAFRLPLLNTRVRHFNDAEKAMFSPSRFYDLATEVL